MSGTSSGLTIPQDGIYEVTIIVVVQNADFTLKFFTIELLLDSSSITGQRPIIYPATGYNSPEASGYFIINAKANDKLGMRIKSTSSNTSYSAATIIAVGPIN
jgi:hypothetical protein